MKRFIIKTFLMALPILGVILYYVMAVEPHRSGDLGKLGYMPFDDSYNSMIEAKALDSVYGIRITDLDSVQGDSTILTIGDSFSILTRGSYNNYLGQLYPGYTLYNLDYDHTSMETDGAMENFQKFVDRLIEGKSLPRIVILESAERHLAKRLNNLRFNRSQETSAEPETGEIGILSQSEGSPSGGKSEQCQADKKKRIGKSEQYQVKNRQIRGKSKQCWAGEKQGRGKSKQCQAEKRQSRGKSKQCWAGKRQSEGKSKQCQGKIGQCRGKSKQCWAGKSQSGVKSEQSQAEKRQSEGKSEPSQAEKRQIGGKSELFNLGKFIVEKKNEWKKQTQSAQEYFKKRMNVKNPVKHLKLKEKMFTCRGAEDDLYFYREDLFSIEDEIYAGSLQKLDSLLIITQEKKIRFLFLVPADKYDLYKDFAVKDKYQAEGQLSHFEQYTDNPRFLNCKELLYPLLQQGDKDIYRCNDTHWSPLAAKYVAIEIKKRLERQ